MIDFEIRVNGIFWYIRYDCKKREVLGVILD